MHRRMRLETPALIAVKYWIGRMLNLIGESPVLVGSEQSGPNAGQCLGLTQLQSLVESVVELDLAVAASEEDTSGAGCGLVRNTNMWEAYLRLFRQILLLVDDSFTLVASLLVVLLGCSLGGLLDLVLLVLLTSQTDLGLGENVHALQNQALERVIVILVLALCDNLLSGFIEQLVQQLLSCLQNPYPRLVGRCGACNLLRHSSLLELLLVLGIHRLCFLSHELGLLDSKLLVGLEVDLTSLFHGFLLDEGCHLLQLLGDLHFTC